MCKIIESSKIAAIILIVGSGLCSGKSISSETTHKSTLEPTLILQNVNCGNQNYPDLKFYVESTEGLDINKIRTNQEVTMTGYINDKHFTADIHSLNIVYDNKGANENPALRLNAQIKVSGDEALQKCISSLESVVEQILKNHIIRENSN